MLLCFPLLFINISYFLFIIVSTPLTIKLNKPKCSLGQDTIFQVLKKSLEDTNNKNIKDHARIRTLRETASQTIKVIKQLYIEISTDIIIK